MDSMRDKKYLFIALIIIGTSPLGILYILNYLNYVVVGLGSNQVSLFRILPILFQIIIYPAAIYIHYYCFQRLGALGYKQADFFRFFIPIYGVYFAYQFGSKLLSGEIELPSSPKNGKGLSF
jgi:hypothetical protein